MNRKQFLATLIGLPAAITAAATSIDKVCQGKLDFNDLPWSPKTGVNRFLKFKREEFKQQADLEQLMKDFNEASRVKLEKRLIDTSCTKPQR